MIGSVLRVRYELTALISDGPIFATYSARDRVSGTECSVRLIKPPFSRETEFTERLAEAVKKYQIVQHPGVEMLFELDMDEETPFLVGQLSRGAQLADRIRKLAPFSIPVAASTAISICQSLDTIHRAGLVHGDVGAHNVVIMPDGEARLQLGGIWEVYSASPTAGAVILPAMAPYLAPEISSGGMPSAASDVYSVGVLLYQLLTGRFPYMGDTAVAVAMKHSTAPTPSVRSLNPSVPMVLDEIVKKAMSKDSSLRYQAAGELLSDLRVLQDALRFGRTLTWPLRPAPLREEAPVTQSKPNSNPTPVHPVAPRMSAIRSDEEVEAAPRKARTERDVPVWMLVSIAFLGAVVLSLIGVWTVFNLGRSKLVTVPNVRSMTSTEARQMLEGMHLKMRIASRMANEKVEADKVLDVSPEPGQKVKENGEVAVVLSSGSQFVEVPDLKNLTIDKAKSILSSLNLDLDPNIEKGYDPSVANGLILRQVPAASAKAARTTRVRVVISSDQAPKPTEPANAAPPATNGDGFLYTLKVKMNNVQQTTHVRVELSDDHGTRTVLDSQKEPGEDFEVDTTGFGAEATFRIYFDDELVKTVTKRSDGTEAP